MSKGPSLVDFAKSEELSRGPKCWLCTIPEREEVEQGVASGVVSRSAAMRWLKTRYPELSISVARVDNHMAHVGQPAKSR